MEFSSDDKQKDILHEDYRTEYIIESENIRFSKQQMWQTFYLTILAIAALVPLYHTLDMPKSVAIILIISAVILGLILLLVQQVQQSGYRERMEKIRPHILSKELLGFEETDKCYKHIIRESFFLRNTLFLIVFLVVIVAAAFLSILSIVSWEVISTMSLFDFIKGVTNSAYWDFASTLIAMLVGVAATYLFSKHYYSKASEYSLRLNSIYLDEINRADPNRKIEVVHDC